VAPLESLIVTGDLDPAVTLSITAEARDDAAARNLADIVRGFTALAALEAGEKPELRELASAVSVSTEGRRVHASARLAYELFDAIVTSRQAGAPGR
jgi:hypothetical protein